MNLFPISALVLIGVIAGSSGDPVQDAIADLQLHEWVNTAYELVKSHDTTVSRVERGITDDISSRFKEFSEKVGKMPDQLGESFKKFMQDRGISLESIQNILQDIWKAMQKLVEEVQKAMSS